MTRQKKSRKPGTLGAKSAPKNLRERKAPEAGKAPHKSKGKPAGNRHSVETKGGQKGSSSPSQAHDPRVGSKRKIPLQVPTQQPSKTLTPAPTATVKEQPPVLSEVTNDEALRLAEDEFARLENDPRLQDLLAQLDAGDKLTASDKVWVDKQLERYQVLADQLGIEAEDEEDELEPWQKFENPKDWL